MRWIRIGTAKPKLLLRGEPSAVPGRVVAEGWRWLGQLRIAGDALPDSEALGELLERDEFELVAPRFKAIERIRLEPAIGES